MKKILYSIFTAATFASSAISLRAQSALPPGKQAIQQLYDQERALGTTNPAPRNPSAPYPIVQPGLFQAGISTDCDDFNGIIISNCWSGIVNGLQTQVYAGCETPDNDPQQGLVAYIQNSAQFVSTPVRAGAVHILYANGPVLTLVSASGPYVFTFDASTGTFTSSALDNIPPTISGMPSSGTVLWPPNKNMVTVGVVSATDAISGIASFEVDGASSEASNANNPDIIITGSGTGPRTVQLRADRLGTGNGRTYTLTAIAVDGAGNTNTATATCVVPHDESTR